MHALAVMEIVAALLIAAACLLRWRRGAAQHPAPARERDAAGSAAATELDREPVPAAAAVIAPLALGDDTTLPADQTAIPGSLEGRILVMDDEAAIREVARRLLGHLGATVVAVSDGDAALAAYARAHAHGSPYDVVLLDLTVIAGMGGAETVRQLRESFPDAVAVAVSGAVDDPVLSAPERHGFHSALHKPFGLDELSRVVGDALAMARQPPGSRERGGAEISTCAER